MVFAELAGRIAEIAQEYCERRSARAEIGRAAGQLRRDHSGAQRVHAREKGIASGGATLHGDIVHHDRAFLADAIDIRRFADHQTAMIDARLHPADVVTHDKEDVGFTPVAVSSLVVAGQHPIGRNSAQKTRLLALKRLRGCF